MLSKKSIWLILWLANCLVLEGLAQVVSSPYTVLGVGDVNVKANVRSMGMGNVGVSLSGGYYSNMVNPATLVYNKLTLFEAAYLGEAKLLQSDQSGNARVFGANLRYMNFAFPVMQRWTIGAGMRPITNVNYAFNVSEKIPGTPTFADYRYSGKGGLTQVYLSNGFYLFKGLSVGLELNYNFGGIQSESSAQLSDTQLNYIIGQYDRVNFSKLHYLAGIHYSLDLKKERTIQVGVTYEPQADYRATYYRSLQRRTTTDRPISTDTLAIGEVTAVTIPASLSAGIHYEKYGKYAFGVEYASQPWSSFQGLSGGGNRDALADARRLSVGGEYTPDYASINNYFKRVTFRAGFQYRLLPWEVRGIQLEDYSATFGFSLPMSRGISALSLAGSYGFINAPKDELVRETYFRFMLGLTINDRWFVRRRFN